MTSPFPAFRFFVPTCASSAPSITYRKISCSACFALSVWPGGDSTKPNAMCVPSTQRSQCPDAGGASSESITG